MRVMSVECTNAIQGSKSETSLHILSFKIEIVVVTCGLRRNFKRYSQLKYTEFLNCSYFLFSVCSILILILAAVCQNNLINKF
jgi:hypothetical protein